MRKYETTEDGTLVEYVIGPTAWELMAPTLFVARASVRTDGKPRIVVDGEIVHTVFRPTGTRRVEVSTRRYAKIVRGPGVPNGGRVEA